MTVALLLLAPLARAEGPLELRDAASRALREGALFRAALAEQRETEAATRLAGDAFHPQVFLTTTPGYSSGLAVAIAGRLPAIATLEAQETFYDPSRRAELLSARAREASARGSIGETRGRVLATVIRAYARLWLDGALLRNAVDREAAEQSLAEEASALEGEGRILAIDSERSRLAVATAKEQRLDAESDRDLDALELAHLMGTGTPTGPLPDDLLRALPEPETDGALQAALRTDPRMEAYGPALEATEAARRERERRFVPVVQAQAQYARLYRTASYDEFYRTFKADDWSVGVAIALPLFSGGRSADAALQARATHDRLVSEQKQRMLDLEMGVARAREAAGRARARTSLARRALGIAEETLAITARLREEGRNGAKELGSARVALANARDELARAEAGELLARADLLSLRGELGGALGVSDPS
jgi:outer membrane protein TolC